LQDEIDPIIRLEETMRNGIVLARLTEWFAPGIVRKIFQVSLLIRKKIGFYVLKEINHGKFKRIPNCSFDIQTISIISLKH
jgi:hypothetical protein